MAKVFLKKAGTALAPALQQACPRGFRRLLNVVLKEGAKYEKYTK